jgi:hypothetical protein
MLKCLHYNNRDMDGVGMVVCNTTLLNQTGVSGKTEKCYVVSARVGLRDCAGKG